MFDQLIRRVVVATAATAAIASFAGAAHAAIDCSVTASPLAFGQYDADSGDLDSDSGQVSVSCRVISSSPPFGGVVAYEIRMSPGLGGSFNNRRMQSGANSMRYNFFVAGTRSPVEIWGDGTSGSQAVAGSVTLQSQLGDSRSRDHIVYGRIPGNQTLVPPGSYSDSILITLSF